MAMTMTETYDSGTNPLACLLCAVGAGLSKAVQVGHEFGISSWYVCQIWYSLKDLGRFVAATLSCTLEEIAEEVDAWEQRMLKLDVPGAAAWFANFRAEVQMGAPE